MKPAPFEYQAPATLREAIDLLVSDPEATVIAGGQSLIPVLAFRLAAPSMLVDLRRVPELGYIAVGESGVRLGARVRWRDIVINFLDRCAITVPIRTVGPPVGLMIVGEHGGDRHLLGVGRGIEAALNRTL